MTTERTGWPSIDRPWMKYYLGENAYNQEESLYEMLIRVNRDRLSYSALDYFGNIISYGELFTKIRKTVSFLERIGVTKGERVLCYMLNTPESIYCIYALNYIGAVIDFEYVNSSPDDIAKSIKYKRPKHIITVSILANSISDIVKKNQFDTKIVSYGLYESLPWIKRALVSMKKAEKLDASCIKFNIKAENECTSFPYKWSDSQTAIIVKTGGTTGVPKGVRLNNKSINLIAHQYITHKLLNLIPGESYQNIAPPFYAFGISLAIHAPLCCGFKLCLTPNPNPEEVAKTYFMYKPVHYMGGPGHIHNILNDKKVQKMDFSKVKTFSVGGESMTPSEIMEANQFLAAHGSIAKMITGYGMSEFGGTVASESNPQARVGSVGYLLSFVNARIIDINTKEELPYGEIGEILLSSASMMLGYDNNVDEEKNLIEIDQDGVRWVKTGDLGYIDEDGFLYIKGRIKRVYLTKGIDDCIYKMFPNYIEEELESFKEVEEAAVIAKKIDSDYYKAYAFVCIKEGSSLNTVIELCKERLPEYLVPVDFCVLNTIPKKENGKVDYSKLEEIAKRK